MYLPASIWSVPTKNIPKACLPNTLMSFLLTGCVYPCSAICNATCLAVAIWRSLFTTTISLPFCKTPVSKPS